jgi:hypothetical protein
LQNQIIVELKNDGMNNIESNTGEIVMYQPDETIRLEVRMGEETVWLSQAQMAELFGTKRQAITKHLQNIYESDELKKEATSSMLELVRKISLGPASKMQAKNSLLTSKCKRPQQRNC